MALKKKKEISCVGAYVSQLVLRDSVWWVDVFAHCVFTCMYMCTCVPVCVRKQLCMLTPAGASRVSYKIFCWGGGGGGGEGIQANLTIKHHHF